MPTDKSGKFHLNSQRAAAADKAPTAPSSPKEPSAPVASKEQSPSGGKTTITSHDKGVTVDHNGEKSEHPSVEHALAHVGAKHTGGKHAHISHGSHGTKSAVSDGQSTEEKDHGSPDEAGQQVSQDLQDGQQDPTQEQPQEQQPTHDFRAISGL